MQTKTLRSEWIPAVEPGPRAKLIVVLHGRGDSPAGFHWLPRALGFRDVAYLLVQAPDAYYTGFSWYDLPPDQGPGILRSRQRLDELFAEIGAQGYRTEDIILFGFSQGCLMTLEWGGRTAQTFAGFLGISGYCYDPEALLRDLTPAARRGSWLITHGYEDAVLPYAVTERQVVFLQAGGLPLRFESYHKEHTVDPFHELPLLRKWIGERFQEAPASGGD